jgi:hypothetical protein
VLEIDGNTLQAGSQMRRKGAGEGVKANVG